MQFNPFCFILKNKVMKKYQTFVGIDVSKSKFDYCIVTDISSQKHEFGVAVNNQKAIRKFISGLQKKCKDASGILFCMENTGVYSMPLCYELQSAGADYWVASGLEIKRSRGIIRGKSDKTDALCIAMYSVSHLHLLKLSELPEADFAELRLLLAEREKLVKALGMFSTTKEGNGFLPKLVLKSTLTNNAATIKYLNRQLKNIESLLDELIERNETFKKQSQLLKSVPGICKQTAISMIAYTQAFTLFKNHRQFACYCGVAPFEYQSGSSIKGKTKVSPLANKKMKTLLNMAALSAKKCDAEMKIYYEKKVAEGKNKMLVINNLRSKIISRAFAVINRDSPYVNTLKAFA